VPGSTLQVTIGVFSLSGWVYRSYDACGATAGWALSPMIAVPNARLLTGSQFITISLASTGTAGSPRTPGTPPTPRAA
jgi:hypothetical protein